ncbi:MAG: 50S ribosomal protein L9 [Rhodobacteraceae bacterium]|nr:50S ribosomal protein L9 [Paracoccaceae bacterium]
MEVVLLERVEKLGQMGDVVRVKEGFARNFLLPQGKALRATQANMVQFEEQRAQLEARNLELKKEAEAVAEKMDGQSFVILRSASESGNLFGSVTARDVCEASTEGGFSVDKRQIVLEKPVKELGLHGIRVVLHPEVSAIIKVNVARTAEEAEIQASGKSVAELRAEEEAAEDLDVAALFEDVGKFDEDSEEGDGEEKPEGDDSEETPRD